LAALRSDPVLQRRTQHQMDEATAQLKRSPIWSQVNGALTDYGAGADLGALPELSRLMSDARHAQDWIAHWVRALSRSLAGTPLGQCPFRHSYSPGLTTLQLAAHGRAVISLLVYESVDQQAQAQSALFVDREQRDLVVSGRGIVEHFLNKCASSPETKPSPIETVRRDLESGDMIDTSGPDRARRISGIDDCLVMLQLVRVPYDPQPSREIQLSDGALLRQSSGEKRASQNEMAMALLGAMERRDAAPVMAAMTACGPDHLRWEALRQSLHLDTVQGFAALRRLAEGSGDPLASSARALKRNLEHIHPALASLESA